MKPLENIWQNSIPGGVSGSVSNGISDGVSNGISNGVSGSVSNGISSSVSASASGGLVRYAIIHDKNPREIVLLRGRGCAWKRCRFCDYHLDFSRDAQANFEINRAALAKVTGLYGTLEVINSGSFADLDADTIALIGRVCTDHRIRQVHFECHWIHRNEIPGFRQHFRALGIELKIKIGIETFDALFRESYLDKGIDTDSPAEIAAYFDEACLLFGLPGQTLGSMERDIETGLAFFERICINIMQKNSKPIQPDPHVIDIFAQHLLPNYISNPRIDILMENTDFGVG